MFLVVFNHTMKLIMLTSSPLAFSHDFFLVPALVIHLFTSHTTIHINVGSLLILYYTILLSSWIFDQIYALEQ
ncbi:hypothetical protein BGW36DRAFT_192031 [Talaromyces proteolyticus]|uniref:Uncharacterized protein n=1 Tax=Talaromyces proteolyticus TaxID=1131652 RepID=A0AAD4KQJ0_9EURO|nr:uncharacterized protein BGW36DRAFT_192031 [Talaromyces proteolyticus]KAH8694866.1 hypothetical protein BGW36DRAFT_192031 [Talaromyces proteolyticus]